MWSVCAALCSTAVACSRLHALIECISAELRERNYFEMIYTAINVKLYQQFVHNAIYIQTSASVYFLIKPSMDKDLGWYMSFCDLNCSKNSG